MRSSSTPAHQFGPAAPAGPTLVSAEEAAWRTGLSGCGPTLLVLLEERFPAAVVAEGGHKKVDLAALRCGSAPLELAGSRISGYGFVH